MKHGPDEHSSHPYEVINLHREGGVKKAVYFYLVEGEPVDIKLEGVLQAAGLWEDPTLEEPTREYRLFLEVRPKSEIRPPELYENVLRVVIGGQD